jgi:phosphotransferase family enzyme
MSSADHLDAPIRSTYPSLDAMLSDVGATGRAPWARNAGSLAGSVFEHVLVDGRPHIVKHLDRESDWVMRAVDDARDGRPPYALIMWSAGLLDALPGCIDHTIVAGSWDGVRCALLMRDASAAFVQTGTGPLPPARHHRFLDHMAQLHATFAGFVDRYGLLPPRVRYVAMTPAMAAREAAAGYVDPAPRAVLGGWTALADTTPEAYELALALASDPTPLVAALGETPATLIHGDWTLGNLGSATDGRTVLIDWAWPGQHPPAVDLAWYLAVNCDLLPESKAETVGYYRSRLEAHGFQLGGTWGRQLELALVGGFIQLGWSKTGDPAELGWWVDRIVPVARDLLR